MIDAMLAEGTAVGRYQIRSLLGAGGMGEVYLAWEATLDRLVALKILRPDLTGDPHRVQRFVSEARAASALNHPAIVTIYEIGDESCGEADAERLHFIAMELVEGVTLDEWMRQKPSVASILTQLGMVAEGLGKAHARGIVHRDLKPENLMVTPDGHPKVLDFGVAKLFDLEPGGNGESVGNSSRRTMTEASSLVGTAGYMAPEQVEGFRLDHRADIFSFGCVLYECLTGNSPFIGATRAETMHNIVHRDPPPVEIDDARVAESVRRIVGRCLAKDREQRYDSARDLSLDLLAAAALSSSARALPAPRLLRRAPRLRAAGSVTLAILGFLVILQPMSGLVSRVMATLAPARHPSIVRLEADISNARAENDNARIALAEREREVVRRGTEIERLQADLAQSERLRGDLETSYRELLGDVEEHLRRTNDERSQLGERVTSAEAQLQKVRDELTLRATTRQHLEDIQRQLGPAYATTLETRGLVLNVPGVFRHSRSGIEPAAVGMLRRLADQLLQHSRVRVSIEAHTDSSGSALGNLELSQERAEGVASLLEELGVESYRISAIGRGEMFPLFSDETSDGQHANRRVEIIMWVEEQSAEPTGKLRSAEPPPV